MFGGFGEGDAACPGDNVAAMSKRRSFDSAPRDETASGSAQDDTSSQNQAFPLQIPGYQCLIGLKM